MNSAAIALEKSTVAILMATRNGRPYLDAQLASIEAQASSCTIDLWISDDGSSDGTLQDLAHIKQTWRRGRVNILTGPGRGFAANFRSLVVNPAINADFFAFSDQDDIWDDDKLAVALNWMVRQDQDQPLLYCGRTRNYRDDVVEGMSPLFCKPPGFRNAIVQSIAGGNTMVLNRRSREAVSHASRRLDFVTHDWWSYLVVTAIGGLVFYDADPHIDYRQHGGNLVGANTSLRARLGRLWRLAGGQLQRWTDQNLTGLADIRDEITPQNQIILAHFEQARRGGPLQRLLALHRSGAYRQTRSGQIALYVAALLRRL